MSICYDFQKWTMISLVAVGVSLTVGLLLINFAHGQNTSSSMVDKLIEDTKKNQTLDESYRAELVNKMTIQSDCMPKQYQELMRFMTIKQLEDQLKFCVQKGIVK